MWNKWPKLFNEKIDEKFLNFNEIIKRVNTGQDKIGRDDSFKIVNINEILISNLEYVSYPIWDVMPPSTTNFWPDIYLASSEAKKREA